MADLHEVSRSEHKIEVELHPPRLRTSPFIFVFFVWERGLGRLRLSILVGMVPGLQLLRGRLGCLFSADLACPHLHVCVTSGVQCRSVS